MYAVLIIGYHSLPEAVPASMIHHDNAGPSIQQTACVGLQCDGTVIQYQAHSTNFPVPVFTDVRCALV